MAPPAEKKAVQPAGPTNLLRPLILLSYSASEIIPTLIHLVLTFQLSILFNFEAFKDAWFARFWSWFGPRSRDNAAPIVKPLLQRAAQGVCLDIGPGSGQWLELYSKAQNPSITKIYGVEPNVGMHPLLNAQAQRTGLGDIYEVLGCGAQQLTAQAGIRKESIDTIITVQCLCSIPTPETVIKELYPLLKPGGKWLVFEHVKTKYQGDFVGYWQQLINLIWPQFFGGCVITRPTDEWLLQAGDWDEVSLQPVPGEGPYDTLPHIYGSLTKRK